MTTDLPGQLNGALPAGARLDTLRGDSRQAGDAMVTPITRRLALRWPGGGLVYAWPSAIEVQTKRGTRRKRIIPVQTVALAALVGIALAGLAGAATQWWLRRGAERAPDTETGERHPRGARRHDNDK
jgi:hypothetical protein